MELKDDCIRDKVMIPYNKVINWILALVQPDTLVPSYVQLTFTDDS